MKSGLLLFLAVFFWAINFHLGKVLMEYVSPNTSAFWRYFFGVIALVLLSVRKFPAWSVLVKNIKGLLLVGFIGLFGFMYLFFQGLNYTSAINGSLIMSLNPVTTLLITVIFQQYQASVKEVLGIILAFIGVAYLLTKGNIAHLFTITFNYGDFLLLLANILFVLHNLWVIKYIKGLENIVFTMLTSFLCLLGFSGLLFWETTPVMTSTLPFRFWAAAFSMGVFGTALTYYCWNTGIAKIGATQGAIFMNALPLCTAFTAIFFGAEIFAFHWISSVLIIGGLFLVQMK